MRALACLVFIALAYAIRGNPDLHKDAPILIGKFPYQVLLRYHNIPYCGGSILNNRNILTSAGCLKDVYRDVLNNLDKLKAHVGTNSFDTYYTIKTTAVPGDVYDIANVTIHENYTILARLPNNDNNDIALIHLKTPIKYKELVQPIDFMTSDKDLVGKPCTLTGWETKSVYDSVYPLKEIEMIVYRPNACRNCLDQEGQEDLATRTTTFCKTVATTQQFCAVTVEELLEDRRRPYNFEFGSPLIANGNQIGILMWNFKISHFKMFTRVSDFALWIITHLKN
ncbi:chymotrypsin-1-like [Temnothorax nylanderi]|uniref:chymotrypsin-1-like n=1 Tax=Temnothorax nylanderi TaxID=102681 RepID=UPI003A847104